MKKIITLLLIISSTAVHAQFKTAMLQASGLTCAMCTKAINNSLEKLSFIQSVKADIKNSAFNIVFKQDANVDIDQLKHAVEEAGFSVAKLKLGGNFSKITLKNNEHVQINNHTFHFLKIDDQVINGEKQITIVDRNYLTLKEFKKFSASTQMDCVQTGKAASCCKKEGIRENTRIYHATI